MTKRRPEYNIYNLTPPPTAFVSPGALDKIGLGSSRAALLLSAKKSARSSGQRSARNSARSDYSTGSAAAIDSLRLQLTAEREARLKVERELRTIKEEKERSASEKKEKEEEYEKFKDFVAKGWSQAL